MEKATYFLPYQRAWLSDDSPVKIFEKSRRIGATHCQSYEDVRDCVEKKVPKVWFSSADESAAKEYIDDCAKWCRIFNMAAERLGEVVVEDSGLQSLAIRLANGSEIHAMSSSPRRFRSKGGKVVLDEFAFHDDAKTLWKAAKPAATWGFPIRILSTHNGERSLFNQFVERVNAGKLKWGHHKVDIYQATEQGLYDKINGRPTSEAERAEWITSLEQDCFDKETFLEEYCCVPVDERSAFITFEQLASVEQASVEWPAGQIPEQVPGGLYVGMDIGRRKDLAVIWVWEKLGEMFFTRAVVVMDRTPFRIQREQLYRFLQHPRFRRACIDETGMGMQLAEEAIYDFGQYRVEGVTFSGKVKEELAFDLKRAVESKSILIPARNDIREDLHSIKRSVTSSGNVRFSQEGDTDGHADRFWAAALGLHAGKSYAGPPSVASRRRRETSRILAGYE
ncbi:MAG TPA: terminase family protein [Tichowtungia sp.]|nr:terminase family protein [Tichowtungia sp.]